MILYKFRTMAISESPIFLWDRVKPLLEALKDAVKANDMSRCYVRVALSGVYNQATGCPSILSLA
ncbi:hypothetical protein AYX13_07059 [Cryptococcus neoformans]|nr:hypothetical protein AYX13_07059 [Cryptococcus neoformans var. grubii]